jgi:hypothetical protein
MMKAIISSLFPSSARAIRGSHSLTHVTLRLEPDDDAVNNFHNLLPRLREFVHILPTLMNLQNLHLDLWFAVSQEFKEEMALVLRTLTNLTSFTLKVNEECSDWLRALAPVFTALHCVKLGFDRHRQGECPSIWTPWFRSFLYNTSIQRLDLSCCNMTDAETTAFAEIVPTMTSLKYVNLDYSNKFNSVGAAALLEAVTENESLEDVVLPTDFLDDCIRDVIFYICKLRKIDAPKLLAEAPLSLFSLVLARLDKEKWLNVMYYLVREKCDQLCQARMGKRKREDE